MFNDFIKKGKEVISKAKDDLEEKRRVYNLQKEEWDKLVGVNHHIDLTNKITKLNDKPSEGRIKKVMDLSPSTNKDKAKNLASIIRIDEVFLDVCYVKEATTNKEYFFLVTNEGIYITDFNFCNKYEYEKIKVVKNVLPGILSSNININNVPFVVEGSKEDSTRLVNILIDANYRNTVISKEMEYLKGIKPTEEYINKYYRGVSIGDKVVVLHGENDNILLNISDIVSIDAILDNSVVYTRGVKLSTAMTSAGYSCYKMSLRFNLKDDVKHTIEILPANSLNKVYNSTDEEYINSYDFCKQVINRIVSLI